MKKENGYRLCNFVSILLVIGFGIKLIKDWVVYNTTLNSAPFYLWVIVDGIALLLPAAILFLIGILLKRKHTP